MHLFHRKLATVTLWKIFVRAIDVHDELPMMKKTQRLQYSLSLEHNMIVPLEKNCSLLRPLLITLTIRVHYWHHKNKQGKQLQPMPLNYLFTKVHFINSNLYFVKSFVAVRCCHHFRRYKRPIVKDPTKGKKSKKV